MDRSQTVYKVLFYLLPQYCSTHSVQTSITKNIVMQPCAISKSFLVICNLLFFLLLSACIGDKTDHSCIGGEPTAIFEGIEAFEKHNFERKEQESIEKITVPDMNMSIELYQSGCDQVEQEFRIWLNEPYELNTTATVCALHISNIFLLLSEKAPQKLAALQQWAEAIRADAQRMVYNERVQLSNSSVYVQIDKMHQVNTAMLTIVLAQASE